MEEWTARNQPKRKGKVGGGVNWCGLEERRGDRVIVILQLKHYNYIIIVITRNYFPHLVASGRVRRTVADASVWRGAVR